jgi:hypothetical protein
MCSASAPAIPKDDDGDRTLKGLAIAGGRIYASFEMSREGGEKPRYVACWSLKDGAPLWSTKVD